jgi:SAM-dependent methyltransferase
VLRKDIWEKSLRDNIVLSFLRQLWTEGKLLLIRGISFRSRDNVAAREAYRQMQLVEFEGINARQRWANWRTIPRNLAGRLPERKLFAVDLCCGTGHSTEVLAYYLPEGTKILGIEFNPEFVRSAEKKTFRHRSGKLVEVSFRAQSVLETFRDAVGNPLSELSVDLVNSCGAVGSHFDPAMTRVLADELSRVLKVGGLALIDSGLPGTNKRQLEEIFESQGFEVLGSAKSSILDFFRQVCFRKTR